MKVTNANSSYSRDVTQRHQMLKLDKPNKVFPAKSTFWKHNVPQWVILNGIEILPGRNETRTKRILIMCFKQKCYLL